MKRPLMCLFLWMWILSFYSIAPDVSSEEKQETTPIFVTAWLKAGPVTVRMPVFHDTKNIKGEVFGLKELLRFDDTDTESWWPTIGGPFPWSGMCDRVWSEVLCDTHGVMLESERGVESPEIAFLATYIRAGRFAEATLEISGYHLFRAFLDGNMVLEKASAQKPADDRASVKAKKLSKQIKLEAGVHLLLVKAMKDPDCQAPWVVKATLRIPVNHEDALTVGTQPRQVMTIRHMMDGPKVRSVSISSDGKLVAVSMQQSQPPSDDAESWIELRQTEDGGLVQTFRGGMALSQIQWSPVGRRLSYISSEKEKKTLWIMDVDKGTSIPLLKDVEDLGDYTWSPAGDFLIYSITEEPKEDKTGLKRLEGMPDRWPWYRERHFLYRVNVADGTRQRLTAGRLSTSLNSVHPDGSRLLFSRSIYDYTERPYSKTEFFVLDLNTLSLDTLFVDRWAQTAQWSPDGKQLLVTGGPMCFDGIGKNVPDGRIPNDYDTQAFLYDLETGRAEPITKEFDPSINQAVWSQSESCIYFNTTDRSYKRLYRHDVEKKNFEMMDTGFDVLDEFDIAEDRPVAAAIGSGASLPPRASVLDLRRRRTRTLINPGEKDYQHVHFGQVERWTFTNTRGTEIDGHVYYPPEFDPQKKYPCIVYYYGGTSPVTRDFGGRYPKEIWAANGYVVYVLQPSGATGYGQAFSAFHVNDWGQIAADEIIDGTKQFLEAHPFIDASRMGCIGASFGGFMTMLLTTRTDMFASAVAHAGISSISSYWGEGYWGYLYSAAATAESFPWNRKDIYVDQSPLFHADKITTPLLLVHGASDTNVPPGESRQLYTALKLLGRDVELVEVEGQNHHIMQYNKRIRWTKTIMAWLDRWLKDQPQWWEDLYSDK